MLIKSNRYHCHHCFALAFSRCHSGTDASTQGWTCPPPLGSVRFCELFGERSELAEKPAALLSRQVEAKVTSGGRFTGGPSESPTALPSHLEEMRIDPKLVPSEKACRLPYPVHGDKCSGLWSREEVTHGDFAVSGSEADPVETEWGTCGLDCSPEKQQEGKIQGLVRAEK